MLNGHATVKHCSSEIEIPSLAGHVYARSTLDDAASTSGRISPHVFLGDGKELGILDIPGT